jgi:hypothetical protein
VPKNTIARHVRVQLEGLNFLHFAQLQVFGLEGTIPPLPPITHVCCGKNVTSVVFGSPISTTASSNNAPGNSIQPGASSGVDEYERAYTRATLADSGSAKMLRHFPAFLPFYQRTRSEHKDQTCDDHLPGHCDPCPLCLPAQECELCSLVREYSKELICARTGKVHRKKLLSSWDAPSLDEIREVFFDAT